MDTLELARIHERALQTIEPGGLLRRSRFARLRRGEAFFYAAVAPLEENHCAESESNGRHKSIIDTLTRRTNDLAASNAELREEVAQRRAAEQSLRASESNGSQLLKKSLETQEELRFLWRHLLNVQEDERRRISRELHDVIAQTLAGINVRLAVLRSMSAANARDFHEKIGVTERLVEQSVEIVSQFAFDLRPLVLDDLGLIPALQSFSAAFTKRSGIPVSLSASVEVETLEASARTALFRIAQEALANIDRHAKASRITVDLRAVKGFVRMIIRDDGQGISSGKKRPARGRSRLGLLGMKERAEIVGGTFAIDSAVGKGTTLRVEIPREGTPSKDTPRVYFKQPKSPKKSP